MRILLDTCEFLWFVAGDVKKLTPIACLLLVLEVSLFAQETSEFQRLRASYDSAVQRAVRPIAEAYLKELGRLRDTYKAAGRAADVQQVEEEMKLVSVKLSSMEGAAPSTTGHRTVVLDSRVTIPANSADGYSLGAVRQGDVITLQYVDGKWKGSGHIPTENPDEPKLEHGDESRLVIARGPVNGRPGEVITMVPPQTAQKPFSYTVATTREEVVLRINKNSDNKNNPGSVIYQVKIMR